MLYINDIDRVYVSVSAQQDQCIYIVHIMLISMLVYTQTAWQIRTEIRIR